jgi:hypothetical protein
MNLRTLTASALCLGLLSANEAAAAPRSPKKERVQLPITGTTPSGAVFAGTLTFEAFIAQENKVFAMVLVSGSLTGPAGVPLGTTLVRVAVPMKVEPGFQALSGNREANMQRQPCDVLHLEVGAVNLNVLGLQVTTLPIGIDLVGEEGVLGQLICVILETLGNVIGLVDLLNQLLGLLGGLI